MLKKMARATFLLMLAVLVVAWAVSLGKKRSAGVAEQSACGTLEYLFLISLRERQRRSRAA